jgi:hypothetical protein
MLTQTQFLIQSLLRNLTLLTRTSLALSSLIIRVYVQQIFYDKFFYDKFAAILAATITPRDPNISLLTNINDQKSCQLFL